MCYARSQSARQMSCRRKSALRVAVWTPASAGVTGRRNGPSPLTDGKALLGVSADVWIHRSAARLRHTRTSLRHSGASRNPACCIINARAYRDAGACNHIESSFRRKPESRKGVCYARSQSARQMSCRRKSALRVAVWTPAFAGVTGRRNGSSPLTDDKALLGVSADV